MKKLLFLIFVFNPFIISAQQIIKGRVLDSSNSEPISYVNIGIRDKATGTISDVNGYYELKLSDKVLQSDDIIFSHLGFEIYEIGVRKLMSINEIQLIPSPIRLEEVVVKPMKTWNKKVGRTARGTGMVSANFYTSFEKEINIELGREKGMLFNFKNDCKLDDFNFCIGGNAFKCIKFRLSIYNIKEGIPDELIVKENIIIEVKDGLRGWVKFDLKPYSIYLKKEDGPVAITLTWLDSEKMDEKSWMFSINAAMLPNFTTFNRDKVMDKWKKSQYAISMYVNSTCYK